MSSNSQPGTVATLNGIPLGQDNFIEALTRVLSRAPNMSTALINGALISQTLIRDVEAVLRKYLIEMLGSALVAGGIGALLPSLAVVLVNAVGFTSGGVAAGSIAAAFQSAVLGGATGGAFSSLQAFGATAMIAHPAVLAVGIILMAGGAGVVGYGLWRKRQRQREAELAASMVSSGQGPDGFNPDHKSEEAQVTLYSPPQPIAKILNFANRFTKRT
ncbi:hypothetical protein CPB83DRAFT_806440 [Crepidotus variabilis]|uniref:Uncharacterized protein n=1 Tax=Crepidotus variabilis TaxID=179855 RepID=A0A9P6EP71_9AGAR|nr:hypothetical protein CPB83DRAFT_806440 [Crepidotus variabilis]